MIAVDKYVQFCKNFHKFKMPKLKFKVLDKRYQDLYRKLYDIDYNDVNKASCLVFISSFFFSLIFSLIFTTINLLLVLLYSTILSLIISYKFNLILYNDILKKSNLTNSILYLIKIDFSLIQKTLNENSDKCLSFIELIKEYRIPISGHFKKIFTRIHEGMTPEQELNQTITPSDDFDHYMKNLSINKFNSDSLGDLDENTLETQFKIYLKQVQSKISILFFLGLFFPIGLCFLILFNQLDLIFLIFLIPLFLISLNLIFRKFIRNQGYLIGLIKNFSKLERKRFLEFILFLRSFAYNLKNNISPEKALITAYKQNKNLIVLLEKLLKKQISYLLNLSYSLSDVLNNLKIELKSLQYAIILEAIKKFINKNSHFTSTKILKIIKVAIKHQKLQRKLEIILKGEKFKTYFFITLLPIITGAISGIFPLFTLIFENLDLTGYDILFFLINPINLSSIVIIILVLLSSISIASFYFLKVLSINRKFLIISGSNIIFIIVFLLSFISISTLV